MLPQLTGLTGLALTVYCVDELPAGLSCLNKLHWLYVCTLASCDSALPAGDWLRSLRRLALEYHVAAASLPQLAQATRLLHLSLLNLPYRGHRPELLGRWAAFWQFVASHPPLCNLDFKGADVGYGTVSTDMLRACMHLAVKRPSLQIAVIEDNGEWPLAELQAMAPADEG